MSEVKAAVPGAGVAPVPGFSAEQSAVIRAAEPRVWVTAAAGSGKTRSLVRRLREHIEADPSRAERTVAFTFTRKAAQEMLERLRREMAEHGSREAVRAVDRLNLGTIDSFCNALVREHAVEAGLDPQFEVLDPAEARLLSQKLARAEVEKCASEEAMAPWFRRFEADDLVSALTGAAERLRSAGDPDALLSDWAAGPGASFADYAAHIPAAKVQLQHEMLEAVRTSAEASAQVLLSGTRPKDAERVPRLRAALEQLAGNAWCPEAWAAARKELSAGGLEKTLVEPLKEAREPFHGAADKNSGWLQEALLADGDPGAEEVLYGYLGSFLTVLQRYLEALAEAKQRMIPRRLDFQDVLLEVLRLARSSEAFRESLATRLQWVMVDELQDVNGLQSQLLDELGRGGRLFGVGDPMQSIYRFRHADVSLFTRRLDSGRTEGDAARYELTTNYRSREGILHFVNAVFPLLLRDAPDYFTVVGHARPDRPGSPPVDFLIVERHDAAGDLGAFELRLAEARVVAKHLRALMDSGFQVEGKLEGGGTGMRPMEWQDVALLFRSGRAIATYVKALEEQHIPAETLRPASLFESVECRDLLALLRTLRNPRHDIALATVLRSPFVDLSDVTLLALARAASTQPDRDAPKRAWIDVLRDADVRATLEADEAAKVSAFLKALETSRTRALVDGASTTLTLWLHSTGYLARESMRRPAPQVAANVDAFLEFCRRHEPSRGDLAGLLERVDALAGSADEPGEGLTPEGRGVQLLTTHAAKGLEYPVVVVAQLGRAWQSSGMQRRPVRIAFHGEGRAPAMGVRIGEGFGDPGEIRGWAELLITREERRQDEFEEKRLLYVAMTRARDRLILAGSPQVKDGERGWKPGYGAWLDAALADLEASGTDLDGLVNRHVEDAKGVRRPAKQSGGVPMAEEFEKAIEAGQALPAAPADGAEQEAILEAAKGVVAQAAAAVAAPSTAAASPRDISVKHMARSLVCPWRFLLGEYIEHVTPMEDRGESSAGGPAMERGQRVHKFFEMWDPRRPVDEDFERAAAAAELTPEDREALSGWLTNSNIAGAIEAMRAFDELHRELDLEWRVADTRIRGRLDAVGRMADGSLTLIDYKTDTPAARARLEPEYERQTALYAAALERAGAGRLRVVTRRLIYLRQGEVVDFEWDSGSAAAVEAAAAVALKRLAEGLAGEAPACGNCPMKNLAGGGTCPERARAAGPR